MFNSRVQHKVVECLAGEIVFACGQPGHIYSHCPQHTLHMSGQKKLATSEPTIGDVGSSHHFFVAVDNHQAKH